MTTESNNGNDGSGHDRQARLAAIIARANTDGTPADFTNVTSRPQPSLRYSSHDDSVTDLSSGQSVTASELEAQADAAGDPDELIADSGVNLQSEVDAAYREYQHVEAKLAEHGFNARTGEKEFRYTGEERRVLELQLNQLRESVEFQVRQGNRIAAQRLRQQAAQQKAMQESIEREARVEKLTADELERIEAKQRAEEIAARRRRGSW